MSIISSVELPDFETWVIKSYPDIFSEWEIEASEYLDLDEWMDMEHYEIIDEWKRKANKK